MLRLFVSPLSLSLLMALVGCGEDPPQNEDLFPFRDEWRTEHEGAFPYRGNDGTAQITTISIGGREVNDNFANRGDVIVEFTGESGEIKVEMRRFTFALDEDAAQEDYDKIHAWMFSANPDSPSPPDDVDPASDCTEGWQEGCGIRIWYQGASQRNSVGADIRVTLPADYRHAIRVVTQDNIRHGQDEYPDRGDVCIKDLGGSAPQINVESGNVFVSLQETITPGPTCSATAIQSCETWTDDEDNDAAWSSSCPCKDFGTMTAQTVDGNASNITVDLPGNLWSYLSLRNELDTGSILGGDDECTADIDIDGVEIDPATEDRDSETRGELNRPSAAAVVGGGYGITVNSERCLPVSHVEGPDEYDLDDPDGPDIQIRGNVLACDGCIREMSCEDLIGGA